MNFMLMRIIIIIIIVTTIRDPLAMEVLSL